MVLVNLDATGRLLRLQVQPWKTDVANPQVNWSAVFSAACLDFARFNSVHTDQIPQVSVYTQFAWLVSYAGGRAGVEHRGARAFHTSILPNTCRLRHSSARNDHVVSVMA